MILHMANSIVTLALVTLVIVAVPLLCALANRVCSDTVEVLTKGDALAWFLWIEVIVIGGIWLAVNVS